MSVHWSPPSHLKQMERQLQATESSQAWRDREFVMLVWWASFSLSVHFTTWARVGDKLFDFEQP